MTEKNSSAWTHHEAVRYDHLRNRYHYLSDKEKKELAYLEFKRTNGAYRSPRASRPDGPWQGRSPRQEVVRKQTVPVEVDRSQMIPRQPGKAAPSPLLYRSETLYHEKVLLTEGLPKYPREEKRKTRREVVAEKARRRHPVQEGLKSQMQKVTQQAHQARSSRVPGEGRSTSTPERKKKRPGQKPLWRRILKWFLLSILILLLVLIALFAKGYFDAKQSLNGKQAEKEYFAGQETRDGVNILVLGTDGRVGQTSQETRTDSIMVVNINNSSGKIKIVSFMRDTLVDMGGSLYKLNTAYSFGEADNHHGADNVREVLKDNFDINISHYALVDFSSFASAIDTLFPNGVEIDAQFATVDGQVVDQVDVPDDLNMKDGVVPTQTIHIGKQRMDGRTLLNYARFRHDDENDFGRTKRQQQVLSAIMTQIKDPTKLFTGAEAIGKIYGLTSTSLPFNFLLTNGPGTLLAAGKGIETTTVPKEGDWVDSYDVYGGLGLEIDFEKYRQELKELGFR